MSSRVSAFVIWSLVAAVIVFWALRFSARPTPAPSHAVAIGKAAPPKGDLARLFGAAPLVALAPEAPAPEAASRFRLLGVMAPRGATADNTARYGLALIAVDGKPPRAFAVGARLDEGLVLQSVGMRTASIGAPEGERSVLLELPPPNAPATGTLPAPGATAPSPVLPSAAPMLRPQLPTMPQPVPPAAGLPAPGGTTPGMAMPPPATMGNPNQPPREGLQAQ